MARASNQFSEGEAILLAKIMEGVSQHKVDRNWATDPDFAGVARKIHAMKASAAKKIFCEDCGDETRNGGRGVRRTCKACGKKVCGYCYHHFHARNVQRLSSSG